MNPAEKYGLAAEANKREGYVLPDHWMLPNSDRRGLWWMEHEAYVTRVCEIVAASSAKTVLEAGCGDGWNCAALTRRGLDVVGCDWSRNGVTYAERMVPEARFYCGDVTDEEFERLFPEAFDAVVLVEVIEHIHPDECKAALGNILTPLRRGGLFVLTTPSIHNPNDNPQHYRHFDAATLSALVSSVPGMTVLDLEGYGDAKYGKLHERLMRFADNRYYRLKPIKKWLDDQYLHKHAHSTPLARSRGLILTATKT